jgi:cAMP-dependent protein kinase regulator
MSESKSKKPQRFGSLLTRWKTADDGSNPFEVAPPGKNSSKIVKTNESAIKEYKKTFKSKNFKAKAPTRGMSVYNKPAQLQNVFGAKLQPELKGFEPPVFDKSESEVEFITGALKTTFVFDDMNTKDLKVFIDAFEPTQVKKGVQIIQQGDQADFFYLIGEGEVSFHVNGVDVGNAAKEASFGELALLYACPRAATVRSEADQTKLYRVDQKTFRSLLQKQTKIMEAQKLTLLGSVDFLKDINEFDMQRLGRAMAPNVFEKGDCLVKKGDKGDEFYIIQEGEMEVTDISVGSTTFDDIVLKAGDYFGERALATNEPRAANVSALTKGTAFSIDRNTFEKVLGKFSRLIMKAQDKRILVRGSQPVGRIRPVPLDIRVLC